MAPKEQQTGIDINGQEVPMEYGKMTPEAERRLLESLQVGCESTMSHILGHGDFQHTLSMLQRVALKQIIDYRDKMQNYDVVESQLYEQIKSTEERLGPRLNLLEVIQSQKPAMALAAEFKRASPSKGDIAVHLNAGEQASKYYDAGASIISCLTEEYWFKGTLNDLTEIREMTQTASKNYSNRQRPAVLRKEFVVNKLQILEAAAAGADTILLIVAITPSDTLKAFIDFCRSLNMEPLVEVHAPEELDVALEAGAKVIGVNNRNLHTFQLDLGTTDRTAEELTRRGLHFNHNDTESSSTDYALCSLSGMSHAEDVERYRKLGVGMVLIGEALMRSPDPKAAISSLCLHPNSYRESHPQTVGAAYTGGTKIIKVCGITNAEDALEACRAGAKLIGIIFVAKSKRCVTSEQAKEVVSAVRNYGERTGRIDASNMKSNGASHAQSDNNLLDIIHNTRALEAVATSRRPLVVGVFQNELPNNISNIVKETGIDLVQLHGDEGMEACDPSKCGGAPAIRVVHMPPGHVGNATEKAQSIVDSFTSSHPQAILLDTSVKGAQGGTGVTFDWNVAEELLTRFGLPVIVAGGLTPDNVERVVSTTKPWGVDVSSGVEISPGKKDHEKVKAFISNARNAASEASQGF